MSPMVDYQYKQDTSIKLCVYPQFEGADMGKPISFTCDVTSSVQHVTLQSTVDLEAPSTDQYTLKVWQYNEYLAPSTLLSQYEYVHNCIKLEQDVVLVLVPDRDLDKSLKRTVSCLYIKLILWFNRKFIFLSYKMITVIKRLRLSI